MATNAELEIKLNQLAQHLEQNSKELQLVKELAISVEKTAAVNLGAFKNEVYDSYLSINNLIEKCASAENLDAFRDAVNASMGDIQSKFNGFVIMTNNSLETLQQQLNLNVVLPAIETPAAEVIQEVIDGLPFAVGDAIRVTSGDFGNSTGVIDEILDENTAKCTLNGWEAGVIEFAALEKA